MTVHPSPASTIIALASRIADGNLRAAYPIRAEGKERRAETEQRPISAARADDPERVYHLFCPEQGGWQTGVTFERRRHRNRRVAFTRVAAILRWVAV